MPSVYNTRAAVVSDGLFTINIIGAQMLVSTLSKLAPDVERELKAKIREAGNHVLSKTRGYAVMGKAPSGAYSGSFSMKNLARGVRIRSNDPGAGAIEFANPGAVYLRGPFAGRRIGTPAVGKPKALIKAANEEEPVVLAAIQSATQRACDQVRGA